LSHKEACGNALIPPQKKAVIASVYLVLHLLNKQVGNTPGQPMT